MIHSTRKNLFLLLGITLTFGCFSKLLAAHHEEPIIEVRVYKVAEGKMEEWERFFHDKLVEPQEEAGIKILTAYRTLGDEDLFVWSRQFSSKANMAKERAAFYQSDLWKKNLHPELKEKGFLEKVEIVYTVKPSKGARKEPGESQATMVHDYSSLKLNAFTYVRNRIRVRESSRFEGKMEMTQSAGRGTCAWLKDLQFTDGTIECDMAGGAYLGISFRVIQDDESGDRMSEDVYFRVEGNERSGTVQYYPHGRMNQEQLHRPPYERPIRLINQKEWFHVRVEVSGRQTRVFLDRKEKPVLVINELLHEHRTGSVGLRSWGGAFANLVVTTKP